MCMCGAVTVFVDLVAIFEGQSSLWQPRTKWASLDTDDGELFMCMDCYNVTRSCSLERFACE